MRIIYLGTADFAIPCLRALYKAGHEIVGIVTQPDRPRGRGKKLAFTPVKEAAIELGVEIFQPERITDLEAIEHIRASHPECLVVVAYGQILPKILLTMAPYGCINVHASLLPLYRGGAPIHRAIMDGMQETGVTTMFVDEKLDTGNIILQSRITISSSMNVGELHDLLAEDGAKLLLKTLELIAEGRAPRIPQVESQATYAPLLTREDERICWGRSACEIVNHIRGMDPWPGAYTSWGDKNLKIWRAEVVPLPLAAAPAGTLVKVSQHEVLVACGDGQGVLITELQLQGKKRLATSEFLKGNPLEAGDCFRM